MTIRRHLDRSQMADKILGVTGVKMRSEFDRFDILHIPDQVVCGRSISVDRRERRPKDEFVMGEPALAKIDD